MHYNWHRYYDPDTGRYLTPAPIGLAGGINPFVYVLNNSINRIDPYGLMDITWGQVGTGVVGGILAVIPEPNTTAIGIVMIGSALMIPGDSSINNPPIFQSKSDNREDCEVDGRDEAIDLAKESGMLMKMGIRIILTQDPT